MIVTVTFRMVMLKWCSPATGAKRGFYLKTGAKCKVPLCDGVEGGGPVLLCGDHQSAFLHTAPSQLQRGRRPPSVWDRPVHRSSLLPFPRPPWPALCAPRFPISSQLWRKARNPRHLSPLRPPCSPRRSRASQERRSFGPTGGAGQVLGVRRGVPDRLPRGRPVAFPWWWGGQGVERCPVPQLVCGA